MGNNTTHAVCYITIYDYSSHVMSDNDIIATLVRETIMNLESLYPTIPQSDNHDDIKSSLGTYVSTLIVGSAMKKWQPNFLPFKTHLKISFT